MLDGHRTLLTHSNLTLQHARVGMRLWLMPSGHRIVDAAIEGYFGVGDLARIFQRLHEEPGFDLAQPTLWDLSKFDFRAQNATQFRGSLFALQHFPQRRSTRRGVLVSSQIGYGMVRMYQEAAAVYYIENPNVFKISYSRNILMAWLTAT